LKNITALGEFLRRAELRTAFVGIGKNIRVIVKTGLLENSRCWFHRLPVAWRLAGWEHAIPRLRGFSRLKLCPEEAPRADVRVTACPKRHASAVGQFVIHLIFTARFHKCGCVRLTI